MPEITLLVLLPVLGALAVMAIPSSRTELVMPVAFAMTIPPLAVALYILWEFTTGDAGFQFTEQVVWYEPWGIGWNVGIDGISLLLIVLTAILFPISVAASASITDRPKMYMALMLILETGLLGVFVALDLLLFFVFFEITLIPMYLLIGIWGSGNRVYAAVKFVLYTAFGSALLLAGIIWLAISAGSFQYADVLALDLSSSTQLWLFAAFGLAFAVKVPLFPLHTWLPDAHTEAPTAGSVLTVFSIRFYLF